MIMEVGVVPGYCVDASCPCHRYCPFCPTLADGSRSHCDDCWRLLPALPVLEVLEDPGWPPGCCHRCGRHGPKPATIITPSEVIGPGEIEARVLKTRTEHGDTLDAFHRVWYESGHTWGMTNFLGVGMMKNPMDLWAYHDLIVRQRPKTILETGTYAGGSALWFAFLMDILAIEGGRVLTVDLDDHRQCQHPRITFFGGDSTDPALALALLLEVQRPLLVTLDSDHSAAHVLKELELYAPLVQVSEYLIIEDTNVSWPPTDRGARGGVEDYLRAHPNEFKQDIICERNLLTTNPGGYLQRIAVCQH